MVRITVGGAGQTVISTFETSPGDCAILLAMVQAAYDEFIRHQPGFLDAALHVNDAKTRLAIYSRWAQRTDFHAMLRSEEMQRRHWAFANHCTRYEPVLYEVAATFDPA